MRTTLAVCAVVLLALATPLAAYSPASTHAGNGKTWQLQRQEERWRLDREQSTSKAVRQLQQLPTGAAGGPAVALAPPPDSSSGAAKAMAPAAAASPAVVAALAPGQGLPPGTQDSTVIYEILRPGELPNGTIASFQFYRYRIFGPQMKGGVTSPLLSALQRTFDAQYALPHYIINVTATAAKGPAVQYVTPNGTVVPPPRAPPPPHSQRTSRGRRLLQGGGLTGALAPDLGAMAPGPSATFVFDSKLTDYAAVDVGVLISFTRNSLLIKRRQPSQRGNEQRLELAESLSTFGYDATFLTLQVSRLDNSLVLNSRLPGYVNLTTSPFLAKFRFESPGVIPNLLQQTALLNGVTNSVPKLTQCRILNITTAANLSETNITMAVITLHINGTYSPQALRTVIQNVTTVGLAKLGAPATVRVSTRYAPELNPYRPILPAYANRTILATGGNATLASGGGGSRASTALIASVVSVVSIVLIFGAAGLGILIWHHRRAKQRIEDDDSGDGGWASKFDQKLQGWFIHPDDIQVCRKEDGTEWLLGEGAYGRVYRGLRGGVQDVAVKQLLHTGDGQMGEFVKEVGVLKGLNYDRNIVQFYGACIQDGSDPMLVTEFMEGGDLCAAIARDTAGQLRWYNRGHRIALDIARGLYFLHSHEVMHSDLKTKNVLLSNTMNAKISDVGLAQLVDAHSDNAPVLAFTFAYAAPETLLGDPSSLSSDIFSFGVVLLEIVTGIMPTMRGKLPPPHVPEDCPQDIWELILQCTAQMPSQRPTAKACFEWIRASCEQHILRASSTQAGAAQGVHSETASGDGVCGRAPSFSSAGSSAWGSATGDTSGSAAESAAAAVAAQKALEAEGYAGPQAPPQPPGDRATAQARREIGRHVAGKAASQAHSTVPGNSGAPQGQWQTGSTANNGSTAKPPGADAAAGAAVAAAQMGSPRAGGSASEAAGTFPPLTSTKKLSSHSNVGAAPPPWPSPPRLPPTPAVSGTASGQPSSETAANGTQHVDGRTPHPVIQQVKQLAARAAKEAQDANAVGAVPWKRHAITDGRQSSVLSDSASSDGAQS